MAVKLIGITGRKFNGKDTLGKYFVEKMGFTRLAFADALKDACKCIFNFNDDQLYGEKKETEDPFWKVTPRKVLQFVGTELFRNKLVEIMPDLGENIWVEVLRKKILDNPDKCFVITDVRFPNECEMIKNMGGIVIRVKRDCMNKETDLHSSELEIEKLSVNFEIENNGTVEEMYKSAEYCFSQCKF